ncbi:DNA-directed RNA polymerase subunit beta [Nocardia farcinica]|uniref:DNA-directed RNA polymerase subunit beta n=1 Tax=Nocardia farcinica TaxID=37329 RepID=UPI0024548080|nr:DNA-directed RNA polymerase subunit beta [Nocardia farcinica]
MTSVLGDTSTSRCQFYRRVCALPAVVRPDRGQIVFRAGSVGAITMPAVLGSQVRIHLTGRNHSAGGVISHPRSKRWTFLICPDVPDEVSLFCELFRCNVTLACVGAEIALPAPRAADDAFRVWVDEPTNPFRPSGMTVIESVRACAAMGSGRHG